MASSAPSDAAVSDPVVGPPPVLCIFPFRDPALPVPRRHKIILMKRRVRLQQEALLLHRQKKETSGKTNSADASKGQEAQKLYLASPLTGFEVNWIMDDSNLER